MTQNAVNRHRDALFTLFLVQGIALASWVTRTPAIRDAVHASTAEMGLILLGMSIGSMTSVLSAGALVSRFGTKPVAITGTWGIVLSMPLIGCGTAVHFAPLVAIGLSFYGLGIGSVEVALNVDGAEVERVTGRPVLAALHGFFSLGTVIGASAGILFTWTGFAVGWHLLIVGALVCVGLLTASRFIPTGNSRVDAGESNFESSLAMARDPRLVIIGVIVLATALAEGTANDWLPLIMVDEHGFDASWGSASYATFAAAMTVGRFAGSRILEVVGRAAVLRTSAIFGAIGLVVVISTESHALVVAAIVMWGLGASLGFPVALSAAGDSGQDSAARVSVVATIGYVAFLAGPPVIGMIGDRLGLRAALVLPLSLVIVAIFLTPAVRSSAAAGSAAAGSRESSPPHDSRARVTSTD